MAPNRMPHGPGPSKLVPLQKIKTQARKVTLEFDLQAIQSVLSLLITETRLTRACLSGPQRRKEGGKKKLLGRNKIKTQNK